MVEGCLIASSLFIPTISPDLKCPFTRVQGYGGLGENKAISLTGTGLGRTAASERASGEALNEQDVGRKGGSPKGMLM